MGTRAYIGILNPDNTVTYSYNHCDGYVKGLGSRLRRFFRNETDVRRLISYGDIESLCTDAESRKLIKMFPRQYNKNSFLFVQNVPYMRILPCNPNNPPCTCNVEDYGARVCEAYTYLFKPAENLWYYTKGKEWKQVKS